VYHSSVRLLLASASPRRAELLRSAGFAFDVAPADVDERVREGESPERYVQRVALDKAHEAQRRAPGRLVLAADTAVVVGSDILGKPADVDDARRMLRLLSGREHVVLTGVAIAGDAGNSLAVVSTRVRFHELTDAEIDWYVASGEPTDKAGAYAIQGLASRFVDSVDGSYSNVVGLPVAVVYRLLHDIGVAGPDAD
jgi:septum formation protein